MTETPSIPEMVAELKPKLESLDKANGDGKWEVKEIDHPQLPEVKQEYSNDPEVGNSVLQIARQLQRVIIDDGFGVDHAARRAFQLNLSEIVYVSDIKEVSKLKGNHISVTFSHLRLIQRKFSDYVKNETLQQLTDTRINGYIDESLMISFEAWPDENIQGYNRMNLKGKYKFAKELDDLIYEVLLCMSE